MLSSKPSSSSLEPHADEQHGAHGRLAGGYSIPVIIFAVAAVLGATIRFACRKHTIWDTLYYFIPWYSYARDHGFAGLRDVFTNYTPVYSYLLLAVVPFERFAEPLTLIKTISALFELGCAIVVAEMVWKTTRRPMRAAWAFATIWLLPTVLFNGALWGQSDSIWTFFILLCVSLFMRSRNGALPFAAAFAIKAQAVFLGPFILGMILRRKLHWLWMISVPIVYLVLALPVIIAGRPLASVMRVYVDQADYYHELNKGAANIWVFAGGLPYGLGTLLGACIAGVAGLALSVFIARSRRDGPEFTVLVACAALFLMPFLLPKMHDRYFYAFELTVVALAYINPRYAPVAALASLDGFLSYLAFDANVDLGTPLAAIGNAFIGVCLLQDLRTGERGVHFAKAAWIKWALATMVLIPLLFIARSGSSIVWLACLVTASLMVGSTLDLMRQTRQGGTSLREIDTARLPA